LILNPSELFVFNDGYSEEMARRSASAPRQKSLTFGDYVAFAAAVPAAWLFWADVAQPIWQFTREVAEAARLDETRKESISGMLGHCYSTPIGSVGAVIRIDSGTTVKLGFKSGITGSYPVASLEKAVCPKD
jgi:hypothetical protein